MRMCFEKLARLQLLLKVLFELPANNAVRKVRRVKMRFTITLRRGRKLTCVHFGRFDCVMLCGVQPLHWCDIAFQQPNETNPRNSEIPIRSE